MTEESDSLKDGVGSKAAELENVSAVVGGAGGGEPEVGEIVRDDSATVKASTNVAPQLHPLENSWTFWFDNPSSKSRQAAWGASIRPIHTFATVEEFWGLYNNILHPSKFAVGADFYCFKYKIEPKWEDPVCAKGGKWTISFPRGKADTSWLYTLLAMIGEQFDHGDEICGAVVNVRGKQEKISLWTKNASNEAAQLKAKMDSLMEEWILLGFGGFQKPMQMSIGRQWKELLDYNDTIGFIFHDDAKKHDRFAKNRYSV